MTTQITIETETEAEIRQLANIVKKALYAIRKELPLEEPEVHAKIIMQVLKEYDRNSKVEFKYLFSKDIPLAVVYATKVATVEEMVYRYQDLAITVTKPNHGKTTLVFRIHNLRIIKHNLLGNIHTDWIYFGKVKLVDYITQQ